MRVSIFGKILGGLSALLLLMLASEGYNLLTLNAIMERYSGLFERNQQLVDGMRSIQVDFKRQVQEWKNILLRSDNPEDFETYHHSFLQKYEEIQQQTALMQRVEMPQESLKLLQQFIIEHQRLQLSYLAALRLFKTNERYDVHKADRSVRGQDRAPTELLDRLVDQIRQDSRAKNEILQQQTALASKVTLGIFTLLSVLSIAIAVGIARRISGRLKEIRDVLKELANGNLHIECLLHSKDEIGDLAESTRQMTAYLQQVAHVTRQVAGDELEIEIIPKSEHDVLNHSLAGMLDNLREMRAAIQHSVSQAEEQYTAMKTQNWSKDGLNQLNTALSGNLSLTEACQIAIRIVTRYVKAGQGVVYIYSAEEESLILHGSFAFTEHDGLSRHYTLGEGIIGQVARDRNPILLVHNGRMERFINSGLISHAPLNTYTLPLVYNNELYGAIELASFHGFTSREQEFLMQAADMIAIAVFSARLEEKQLQKIEEREHLEQHPAQECRLLRKLIDNLPDYIYAKDLQSRFILANQPLAGFVGVLHSDGVLGKTDFDFHPKAFAEASYRDEQALMQSGQELRGQEQIATHKGTGEEIWLRISKIPFQDRNGRVAGFIGIGQDITEHKRTVEALRELQEHFEQQLHARSAQLLQANRELEQRVRELESA